MILNIDIETYSETDLKVCGLFKYVEDPSFEVLLFAYSLDGGEVEVVDLANGQLIPADIEAMLTDPGVTKKAWNAAFERTCLAKYLGTPMPASQWQCTMVHSAMAGYPFSLDQAGKVLGVDAQKDAKGKLLIKYFSIPCKPTIKNGGRTRNFPEHDLEKWQDYINYCAQDVRTEMAIGKKLTKYTIPETEHLVWQLDQDINDTGVMSDSDYVDSAIELSSQAAQDLVSEMVRLTKLENPNSLPQLKSWIYKQSGLQVESLNKESVPKLIADKSTPEIVKRVLEIRSDLGKTSVTKYAKMRDVRLKNGRLKGLFQYYGASRTGRWAGRLVQLQNLTKHEVKDFELARELVKNREYALIDSAFGSVMDILSQLIRTSFVAPDGYVLIASDFSAIEARVIAWLAGEKWRMDVFNTHGKIYEASAAQMFKVPIETITKDSPLRQKGKVAELALGYQGSAGALVQMGALEKGLEYDELGELVSAWRAANPQITKLWNTCEMAAKYAIKTDKGVMVRDLVTFQRRGQDLRVILPSGRHLNYVNARCDKFNKIEYYGLEKNTWCKVPTYGGKLVENIVQAIARDCLAVAMLRLKDAGYKVIMSVHDEVVLEVPEDKASIEAVNEIMNEAIPWANGLPLKAESFISKFYKK